MDPSAATTPAEIARSGEHDVRILWRDGHESVYPARYLRLQCRCAVCIEEMTGQALLDPETVPGEVHPLSLELVGSYAIQPRFSDGHVTGIYTFDRLRAACPCSICVNSSK
jgi:ATP-binding protein involved in chromosome partitioning